MRKIYTRTGDEGTTGIHGGTRVPKDDIRIEANGCLDDALSDRVADGIEQYVNVERLLEIVARPLDMHDTHPVSPIITSDGLHRPRIAVAQDVAFNFLYKENLDVLSQKVDVVTFSPLSGDELPQADYVYRRAAIRSFSPKH